MTQKFYQLNTKIIQETQKNINNSKKMEHVLNKNYKFNFSFKDLKNFKNSKR